MNWYIAKLIFRIICGEGDHKPQFDEQLRLISAFNEGEAFDKAQNIGASEQDSFLNQKSQLVQWQFINVSELHKLSSLTDGVEMYSRVQEAEHAMLYIEAVNRKADHIRSITSENVNQVL